MQWGEKKEEEKSLLRFFESKSYFFPHAVIGGSYFQDKIRKTSLICSIVLRKSYIGHKERDGICLDRPLFHIFQTCMEENASRLWFGCLGKHFAMPSNTHPDKHDRLGFSFISASFLIQCERQHVEI